MTALNLTIPASRDYEIHRARVPAIFLAGGAPPDADRDGDGCVLVDLSIADGRITRIATAASEPAGGALDVAGRQVWPTLVDMHTHLDKAHTVARTPNPDGSFAGARDAIISDRTGFWDA